MNLSGLYVKKSSKNSTILYIKIIHYTTIRHKMYINIHFESLTMLLFNLLLINVK